uniref:Uncharacterized protein n=1 Tax=Anopheles farauti TaxID=69004 RepID=A0A182QJY9_9DIPT
MVQSHKTYPLVFALILSSFSGYFGQFLIEYNLPMTKTTASSVNKVVDLEEPAPAQRAPCPLETLVNNATNGSYIISDRVYDITTLDLPSHGDVVPILRPILEHRCITVRIQSQLLPNSSELVEGVLEIFCGLKPIVQFSFWINQETGCTDLFLGNVRVDLERCGTIDPARRESFYRLMVETGTKIVFQLGFEQSPTLEESVPLPNHDTNHLGPASIEDMFKCNCTPPREAFKALKMCVIGSVNNITKLIIHISVIVSIAAGTTCLLISFVWLVRKIWKKL